MIAAAVAINAVVHRNAAVSASHAATNAVTNAAINVVVDMVMVMVMDMVTDLDLADAGGSGLFLSYSSAVADAALAEDLEDLEDILDSSKN